jgi:hypothetical protein
MASKSTDETESTPGPVSTKAVVADTQPAIAQVAATQLTLNEFCIRLSQRERRVTLIGGFEAVERKALRTKDTEASYQSRYDAFINQPA